jgi:hypothetical protein
MALDASFYETAKREHVSEKGKDLTCLSSAGMWAVSPRVVEIVAMEVNASFYGIYARFLREEVGAVSPHQYVFARGGGCS